MSIKSQIIEKLLEKENKELDIGTLSELLATKKDTIRRTIKRSIEKNENFFRFTEKTINRFRVVRYSDGDNKSADLRVQCYFKMLVQFIENDLPADNFDDEEWELISKDAQSLGDDKLEEGGKNNV